MLKKVLSGRYTCKTKNVKEERGVGCVRHHKWTGSSCYSVFQRTDQLQLFPNTGISLVWSPFHMPLSVNNLPGFVCQSMFNDRLQLLQGMCHNKYINLLFLLWQKLLKHSQHDVFSLIYLVSLDTVSRVPVTVIVKTEVGATLEKVTRWWPKTSLHKKICINTVRRKWPCFINLYLSLFDWGYLKVFLSMQ